MIQTTSPITAAKRESTRYPAPGELLVWDWEPLVCITASKTDSMINILSLRYRWAQEEPPRLLSANKLRFHNDTQESN
jgi:hypothetical protein